MGGNDGSEIGLSAELLESKSKKWIFDGWSLDAFGSRNNLGLGVAKDLISAGAFELDLGIYATRKTDEGVKAFFSSTIPTDIRIGFSGSWRF